MQEKAVVALKTLVHKNACMCESLLFATVKWHPFDVPWAIFCFGAFLFHSAFITMQ